MKRKIKMQVFPTKEDKNPEPIDIEGRLLGIASKVEAGKIIMNVEVNRRVCTSNTMSLADVVGALIEHKKEISTATERLIVAVNALKYSKNPILLDTLTRQLFVSRPIFLVSETSSDKHTDMFKATLECDDGSLIIINEYEGDKE